MKPVNSFSRREFIATTAAAFAPRVFADAAPRKLVWGNLLHLGYNMWADRAVDSWGGPMPESKDWVAASDTLRFDRKLWDDLLVQMAAAKMNLVVIDLGEGVRYDSHPELGVKGSWTPKQLRERF